MRPRFGSGVCLIAVLALLARAAPGQQHGSIHGWLTTPDRSSLLAPQPAVPLLAAGPQTGVPTIRVDGGTTYQSIDGFGFTLTGGSAQLMLRMDLAHRRSLIEELFGQRGSDARVSYLRLSIGASDMNDHVYTYDDMPPGGEDPQLRSFSLEPDRETVIPVLKEILAVAPQIKILATPWTAPAWMKTNGEMKGGSLKPEDYAVYARYLVRYLDAMRGAGIHVDALTMQNEPLNANNTPSMVMQAGEEAQFLKSSLGPLLRREHLRTRVVLWDHNCDHPEYPMSILADPDAAQYADGSGFHLYAGSINALSEVHDAYPRKQIYFTEQMVIDQPGAVQLAIAPPVQRIVIGALANWSRNVLLWNLAADPHNGPHTANGGCPVCEGAVTIDGNAVTRNLAFFTLAHASRFIPPGSMRIQSIAASGAERLAQVAFRTPDGDYVLLVANDTGAAAHFRVQSQERSAELEIPSGAVATYTW